MTTENKVTNGLNLQLTSGVAEPPNNNRILSLLVELREAVRGFQAQKVRELLVNDKCPIDRTILKDAAVAYFNRPVFETLALHLSEQRQHLMQLARTHLPQKKLLQLGIQPQNRVLDSQAVSVAVALIESKTVDHNTVKLFVPDLVYASSATSVYFLVGCNEDAAQILYNVGFKSVDEMDHLMYSPLAALTLPEVTRYHGEYQVDTVMRALSKYINMCLWLQGKGASLHRVFGLAHATPLHHVAGEIGKAFAPLLEEQREMSPWEDTETYTRIFIDK